MTYALNSDPSNEERRELAETKLQAIDFLLEDSKLITKTIRGRTAIEYQDKVRALSALLDRRVVTSFEQSHSDLKSKARELVDELSPNMFNVRVGSLLNHIGRLLGELGR